jgi:activator of HSP90 ATPase
MSWRSSPGPPPDVLTRRQIIAGFAMAFGGLAVGPEVFGKTARPQKAKEAPGTGANRTRTFLHQEVDFSANAQRIYELLLDSKAFATCTGLSATIDPKPGGAFVTFGGLIVGRNVELVPNRRIVQAWRPTHWDPGVYSIVRFELKPRGSDTLVALDHTGFPEGEFDSLNAGWKPRYWDPMKKFLS